MKKAIKVNADMLEAYKSGNVYASTMLMGEELTGEPGTINVNHGVVSPHERLGGGVHEDAELYFVFKCGEGAAVVMGEGEEETRYEVKPGDLMYIPGGLLHWIDNRACDEEFVIITLWPRQEQNEMYFVRKEAWGNCFRFKN